MEEGYRTENSFERFKSFLNLFDEESGEYQKKSSLMTEHE